MRFDSNISLQYHSRNKMQLRAKYWELFLLAICLFGIIQSSFAKVNDSEATNSVDTNPSSDLLQQIDNSDEAIPLSMGSIMVDSPRPMSDIAAILTSRHNSAITYEDFAFASPNDLRSIIPGESSNSVPKNSRVCVDVPRKASLKEILELAVSRKNSLEHGGKFQVSKNGDVWLIFPVQYENAGGEIVDHNSIINTPLPNKKNLGANGLTAIETLIKHLDQQNNGIMVLSGRLPKVALSRLDIPKMGADPTCRDMLVEILAKLNLQLSDFDGKMVWQLRYSPPIKNKMSAMWSLGFMQIKSTEPLDCELYVDARRPMAIAAEILQKRFGDDVVITYEDPLYSCSCEILGELGTEHVSLAGGMISLGWDLQSDTPDKVLPMLMDVRIEPRDPEKMFKVERKSSIHYCIYPAQARDKGGDLILAQPPLSQQIRLNLSKSSVAEALDLLCKSISGKECQVNLKWSSDELGKSLQTIPCVAVSDALQEARGILGDILWSYDPRLSWEILYDLETGNFDLTIKDI